MKNTILFALLMLNALKILGQNNSESEKLMVKAFITDVFYKEVSQEQIKKKYLNGDSLLTSPKDTLIKSLIDYVRTTDGAKFAKYPNAESFTISPYEETISLINHRLFYNNDKNSTIYGVVADGRVLMYVLTQKSKILSFFSFDKGKKDWSYFLVP